MSHDSTLFDNTRCIQVNNTRIYSTEKNEEYLAADKQKESEFRSFGTVFLWSCPVLSGRSCIRTQWDSYECSLNVQQVTSIRKRYIRDSIRTPFWIHGDVVTLFVLAFDDI